LPTRTPVTRRIGLPVAIDRLENTQSNVSGSRTFKITGTGVADDDITAHNSWLEWRRAAADYHQTP
jgi:hypothetical protein